MLFTVLSEIVKNNPYYTQHNMRQMYPCTPGSCLIRVHFCNTLIFVKTVLTFAICRGKKTIPQNRLQQNTYFYLPLELILEVGLVGSRLILDAFCSGAANEKKVLVVLSTLTGRELQRKKIKTKKCSCS